VLALNVDQSINRLDDEEGATRGFVGGSGRSCPFSGTRLQCGWLQAKREVLINTITKTVRSIPKDILPLLQQLGQALRGRPHSLWTDQMSLSSVGLYDRTEKSRVQSLPNQHLALLEIPVLQQLLLTQQPVVINRK